MLSKKSKAIGFIIMSAFGFAMMAAFVRLAGDLPFTQKTFFRNLVAVAVAAVVGYICIRLLKMIADKGKFGWFAYYCWAVGLIVLALTLVLK